MPGTILDRRSPRAPSPAASTGFAVPDGFWDRFLHSGWDHSPRVLAQPFPSPLASPGEAFESVKTASAGLRAGDRRSPMRFLMEEEFVLIGPMLDRYLPVTADQSLAAYGRRIAALTSGRRFGLALNLFHVHDWELWTRMRDFAGGLSAQIPPHYVHPAIFLGNYDRTPFGIHRDPIHTFMFVLQGRKRLHVWARDYFKDENDPRLAHGYEHLLPDAVTLEGGPGDVLFWPIDYWHVGESVGGMSISVNIGFHTWHPYEALATRLKERSEPLADRAQGPPFDVERLQESATGLAAEIGRRAAAVQESANDPALRHALEVSWLNHLTGSCFNSFPDPLPWYPLEDAAVIRGCRRFPTRTLAAPDRKIVLSANGLSFTLPANPRVAAMAQRLNDGEPCRVGMLLDEYAGEGVSAGVRYRASREGLRTVLTKLRALRAVSEASCQRVG